MEAIIVNIGNRFNKHYYDHSGNQQPLSIGRAYENDVVLTDPYVDTAQLLINPASDGTHDWNLEIPLRTNPVFHNKKPVESAQLYLKSGDEITIGRTSIHFYAENHPVHPTREFSFTNWLHNHQFKPLLASLMLAILFILTLFVSYQQSITEIDWGQLSLAALVICSLVVLWAAGWALAGRIIKGDSYFSSHLFFTSLCFILSMITDELDDYVDYIFSSVTAGVVIEWIVSALILGLLLAFNLALATNNPNSSRRGFVASLLVIGLAATLVYVNKDEYSNIPVHSGTIKPSYVPTTRPISIEQYVKNYQNLFDQLAALKHSKE